MLKHFILFGSVLSVLTACGGGGGGGTKAPEPTPVSSSSSSVSASSLSSSSSSSVNPCNNTSGMIYSECLNTNYGFIIGAQYVPSYLEYTESTSTQQVQWSEVNVASPYNKVLDVKLTDSSRKGQFFIGHPGETPSSQDLRQFQTGTLEFDMRVLNAGDAYDAKAGGVVFSIRMDCVWPCSSHEANITVTTVDTWMHVNLSVADLVAVGLDPSKVSASLVLIPRGNQANLHFQLDNIQLIKGSAVEPSTIILKEDFNTKAITEWQFTKAVGNPSASASTNNGFGPLLNLGWLATNEVVRFETALGKNIDITNTDASFQINCWANSTMNFGFQMIATDVNSATVTTKATDATSLNKDNWYSISASLGSVFDNGFDPKRVSKFGLQFTYSGSLPSNTFCQVDTIRIKPATSALK